MTKLYAEIAKNVVIQRSCVMKKQITSAVMMLSIIAPAMANGLDKMN